MATKTKPKDAIDKLLDTFGGMLDEAAAGMSQKELKESEKKFNDALGRATAARKSRRSTV